MACVAEPDLGTLALARLRPLINVSKLHPLDEQKLVALLVELYAVGERPETNEMDRILASLWPGRGSQHRRVLELWKRVLQNPRRDFRCLRRGCPWRYPFLLLEQVVEEAKLEPVGDRLSSELGRAATAYVEAVGGGVTPRAEAEAEAAQLASATYALLLWGATRDAHPEAIWPGHVFRPVRDIGLTFARCTQTGRAREQARLERLREQNGRELPTGGGLPDT